MNYHEEEVKAIFYQYYAYLLKFAISILNNKEDAEDIVIKAFCRFIPQYENFKTADNIKAYLFISVKNDCLNHIKQNKRHDRIKDKVARSMNEEEGFEFHESMSEITMKIF